MKGTQILLAAACLLSMGACSKETERENTAEIDGIETLPLEEGVNVGQVYEGTAAGYGGDVTARIITDTDGTIIYAQVFGEQEDQGQMVLQQVNDDLQPLIGQAAADAAIPEVEMVSGATVTVQAVQDALDDLGL